MRRLARVLVSTFALPLLAQQQEPVPKAAPIVRNAPLIAAVPHVKAAPLSPHERTVQMLDRFTFGARPGEIERVEAMGVDKWFEQQLKPESIPDGALERRLTEYPTLSMTPEQILTTFPDRGFIQQIAEGKRPYPADPLLASMYEVQVTKYNEQQVSKKLDVNGKPPAEPTEAARAQEKTAAQALAAHISGELFALPRNQRMMALARMPAADRIAFTSYVGGDQRNLLLAEFTPREREIFRGMAANVNASGEAAQELAQAKMVRAILSERQLQEVMTDFWFNHFNVYIGKDSDQWYTTSYERDVIRKNALGKFRDLLLATASSPAMMVYLDNYLSIGPDSPANGVNPANPNARRGNKGLNENYGREVMELHTVGVNGGYTQADVTALSAILTGWGVDRPNEGGPFAFNPRRHEPGGKEWYGLKVVDTAPQDGDKQGILALSSLAARKETAHFISYLLAQRFVADEPPPAMVEHMAKTFLGTDGDIKSVLRAMTASPEFNSRQNFRNKVKTPMEFVASAFRTTGTDPTNPGALVNTLSAMGMPLYYALPPTGYYITADRWMNAGALVDRLNFAYRLTNGKFANQKFDSAHVLALGLMAQPKGKTAAVKDPEEQPRLTDAALTDAPVMPNGGPDVILRVLEDALIGGPVSAKTNELIHKQLDQQSPNSNPNDTLNLLTALVMGSPEFQLR